MNDLKVLAVGSPPGFRKQVATALSAPVEDVDYIPTVTAAEDFFVGGRASADVLVISPQVEDIDALELAEFISRSSPTTAVILVRTQVFAGLTHSAMRSGVRDVVDLTQGKQELREALVRVAAWAVSIRSARNVQTGTDHLLRRGKIISVFSSKGGTGKTFLATNLAAAVATKSQETCAVVDLDLGMGDVFSYFGREATHPLHDLVGLGEKADRDAIMSMGTRLHDHLTGFGALPDPAAQAVSGGAVGKMLSTFRSMFDYTVVDLGPNYSDHTLAAFDVSDTVCLVAGLDVVGIKHLSKSLETLLSIGLPRERFRVVLNRADSKVGIDPADVAKVIGIEVDAMIPSSRLVPMSLNQGTPVFWSEPRSEITSSLAKLAGKLLPAGPAAEAKEAVVKSPRRRLFFAT